MSTTVLGPDVYFKKRISYTFKEQNFDFDVANTLFSSFKIDQGTDLLLRTLDVASPRNILDLGCGYGVMGIVLARLFPEAQVIMSDNDLLAVRYARHNCALNNTPNTQVIGGVGLEQTPLGPYDLIVSNIPAKIGDDAIEQEFILGPLERLRPGEEFWFVVISGLNRLIPKIGARNRLKLKEVKKRSGHTVYRILKPKETT
ncbi:MAG: class I SAM-dependent methyltransferase [Candidatus Poribacteria bacterium]